MEVLSSATSPFKRRKLNSSYDDDVDLVTVTSPEISPGNSPASELLSTDPKVDSVGSEISKLIDRKLSVAKAKFPEIPKSPMKKRMPASNFNRKNIAAKIPPADEIEEFFSVAEKCEQKHFIEKYNFDIVKDVPLEGHYQWILLKP